ncbi:MAG: ABC transporter permease [Kiritimatiellae bacterium]|nr:ABC transporter permease [Kiritimatiellia bacterium]
MKARHICATLGIAAAVGAVVFMQSLVATNDRQAVAMAERMLSAVPVEAGAKSVQLQLDFRPDGRVLQGPPMIAFAAVRKGIDGALVTKALFAQRRVKNLPSVGDELTLVGRKGAYRVRIAGFVEWERPVRGYPNMFLPPSAVAEIDEDWQPFEPVTAEEAASMFMSDAGRNMDRAKGLLLWAAALTALCLLVNSLFLSVESRRRELAVLRMVGLTRFGVAKLVAKESLLLSLGGLAVGTFAALAALRVYVACDAETFPSGTAVGIPGIAACIVATPLVALFGALLALKPALSVRPLEAASGRAPRKRHFGMLVAFAFGFGAFVAVEVWGSSLTKPFIPSPEWPDAIVSILPGGVSSFDIEHLRNLKGVKRIGELQPLQVNLLPLEELKGFGGGGGRGGRGGPPRKAYRNALLLASAWLPDFRFSQGDRESAEKALAEGDNCVVTEMMAHARNLKLGDELKVDAGRGLEIALKVVGVVDLNWHMVTSRALVRGMNRMPVNTDGPVFVSFDTLAACDMRPQEFVKMTHVWLDYEPEFLAANGVFPAGRIVEREIVEALGGAWSEDSEGEIRGNAVRLHSRDEIADGTLAHGSDLVGAMARVPFIFLAVISLGFVAMLVASFESRRREFVVLRAVGATRFQLAKVLVGEALAVAVAGVALGLFGGALVGWLCTAGTRAAMSNWGLPATFAVPLGVIAEGALGAVVFALLVAVPTALAIVRRSIHR